MYRSDTKPEDAGTQGATPGAESAGFALVTHEAETRWETRSGAASGNQASEDLGSFNAASLGETPSSVASLSEASLDASSGDAASVAKSDATADPHDLAHARLSDQLCFTLYTASKAVTGAYRPLLANLGLTYPQYLAMLSLWERDLQTVAALGTKMGLDSGTLSPLLKRLEGAGFIRRQRSAHDERSVVVGLTPQGRALEQAAALVRAEVEAATQLSTAEFVQLRQQLKQLTENIAGTSGQ